MRLALLSTYSDFVCTINQQDLHLHYTRGLNDVRRCISLSTTVFCKPRRAAAQEVVRARAHN